MSESFHALHKDAKYPSSVVRKDIMREVLGGEGEYGYSDHAAYPFVLPAMHKVLSAADKYMFRQYFLRDCAVSALKDGDTDAALDYLKMIGE